MGVLKYKNEIAAAKCGVCPPSSFSALQEPLEAVRFAKSSSPTKNDYLPVKIQNPARVLSGPHERRCSGYAISLFQTVAQARKFLNHIAANSKKLGSAWSCCHKVTLNPGDGIVSPVDDKGHFDFHEYNHVRLETQSIYAEAL